MTDAERDAERERLQRMLEASQRMQSEGGYKDRIKLIQARLAALDGE